MDIDNDLTTGGVRVIKASEFKAKCLQLMDEVAASGEEIVITKRRPPGLALGALPGEVEVGVWPQSRQHPQPEGHRGADASGVV